MTPSSPPLKARTLPQAGNRQAPRLTMRRLAAYPAAVWWTVITLFCPNTWYRLPVQSRRRLIAMAVARRAINAQLRAVGWN